MPPDNYRILPVYLKVLIFLRGTLPRVGSLPVHFFLSVQEQTGDGCAVPDRYTSSLGIAPFNT